MNLEDVGGLDTEFVINVYDWDMDGGHDLIGNVTTTLREWTFGSIQQSILSPGKSSSSGGFSIDQVIPLDNMHVKTFAPCYKIKPSGMKLVSQDLLSKAGIFIFHLF